ncbi:hypothetical protein PANDA_006047 [Ailuropoda melanoleuca]|uniref:N-acetylgalactosaminyl-proteoglycan 3-beta-glucuronosyltransferase n=1 Tax=Ailuropoda melanoleuca TaxID=9646 RepID=D2H7D7_AILME|nr:hypothetical protein PANDA_006047 [Ailuropoda melanoleuca]
MTAQKYLGSRALAAQRTWARFIPGRVEFFSSQQSPNAGMSQPPPPLPVIALPGVDDSYPPQKKSFMMIKYMHDHYLDKYEWFMRADDDVYIKGDKLEEFLRSLNSSKPLYLGQTGLGNIEELGKLGLEPGENFCMGGPGMIFSREVLRRMVPHIGECLREMYTTHEDVEVGRCVRRFGGTQCVWSYEEMMDSFSSFPGMCVPVSGYLHVKPTSLAKGKSTLDGNETGRPEHTLRHEVQLKKDLFKKDANELVLQDSMVNSTGHMYVEVFQDVVEQDQFSLRSLTGHIEGVPLARCHWAQECYQGFSGTFLPKLICSQLSFNHRRSAVHVVRNFALFADVADRVVAN